MTKHDITLQVAEKTGYSKRESEQIVDGIFEVLKATVENGERIKIAGFGNFELRYKRKRIGRNPYNGESIMPPFLQPYCPMKITLAAA